MPLTVNLRHLDEHEAQLEGELSVQELDIVMRDEVIRLERPLEYKLEAQKLEGGLLVQGRLRLVLECQCVRCLKPFQFKLELPAWACHLPLQGEDAPPVSNDSVDLTPFLREDILLEFPQHPLCKADCRGLPKTYFARAAKASGAGRVRTGSPVWEELNKLKL